MSDQLYKVIKRPVITEKSNFLREQVNQYVFEVAGKATKVQIRQAVEQIFGVRVINVHTSVVRGKVKRIRSGLGKLPNWKKAIVSIHEDDDIPLFEGA
jgi:large subunit ribosomal protein L23